MTLDEFVSEVKIYLKIKETDVDNDEILLQSATAAAGYISAYYSYYIIESTVDKEFYGVDNLTKKFYLDVSPVTAVVPHVNEIEVIDNTYKVLNNTVYFTDALGVSGDLIKLSSTVGVDSTDIHNVADIAQACALAGYFYKQADKGLVGVEQYGTGIKESARLFEGIPKAILDYFQMKKIYRF